MGHLLFESLAHSSGQRPIDTQDRLFANCAKGRGAHGVAAAHEIKGWATLL